MLSLQKHISREDAIASIKKDYESNYFVSGEGALDAYDPDCLFKVGLQASGGGRLPVAV